MIESIGEVAGKIWNYLDEKQEATLTNLKKDLNLKADQAGFSLGWLAREGKVGFYKKGVSLRVHLLKEDEE